MNDFTDILAELKWRAVFKEALNPHLINPKFSKNIYLGIDPTQPAIHLGNFLQLLTLVRFQRYGFRPIVLIGDSTALVGDPSGKAVERKVIATDYVRKSSQTIATSIQRLFPEIKTILFNSTWLSKLSLIHFLTSIGKKINISRLLTFEKIKTRVTTGISFCEFTYNLLQAYDFYFLNTNYNCAIQLGGADQWVNIASGIHMVGKISHQQAAGVTTQLLVDKKGVKLGKTTHNALFLDPHLTKPWTLFNFFFNIEDQMIGRFVRMLTLISPTEFEELQKTAQTNPSLRSRQMFLAKSILTRVYGVSIWVDMMSLQQILYHKSFTNWSHQDFDFLELFLGMQLYNTDTSLLTMCQELKICASRKELLRLIQQNSLKVNNQLVSNAFSFLKDFPPKYGKYWIISKGKRYFMVVNRLL